MLKAKTMQGGTVEVTDDAGNGLMTDILVLGVPTTGETVQGEALVLGNAREVILCLTGMGLSLQACDGRGGTHLINPRLASVLFEDDPGTAHRYYIVRRPSVVSESGEEQKADERAEWHRKQTEHLKAVFEASDTARLREECGVAEPAESRPEPAAEEGPRWNDQMRESQFLFRHTETGEMPRWPVPHDDGLEVGEFICHLSEVDRDFYACKLRGFDRIVGVGDRFWSTMPIPGQETCNCKTWLEYEPDMPLAKAYRTAYDRALASGKLPPHPRWEKPEGAEVFLGWFDCGTEVRFYDSWWGSSEGEFGIFLVTDDGSRFIWQGSNSDYDSFRSRAIAFNSALVRARELGLIKKPEPTKHRTHPFTALTRQLADVRREREEATI